MKLTITVLMVCFAIWAVAEEKKEAPVQQKAEWSTDLEQAKKTAAGNGKTIFAFFTGSDWCSWCMKMHEEILSSVEFQNYAAENLVLLKIDFPRKTKLAKEQAEKNARLAETYKIEGFPTVVLLDAQGKETGRESYKPGGGAAFVEALKALKKTDKKAE